MTATLQTFARQAGIQFPERILAATQRASVRAGLVAKDAALAELASVVPSRRLRNLTAKGAPLGVRVKALNNGGAVVAALGPWHIVEFDTKAHEIRPKQRGARALRNAAGRGERATNRQALLIGSRYAAKVNHPGTKGRHPFRRGVRAATPAIPPIFQRALAAEMARTFR